MSEPGEGVCRARRRGRRNKVRATAFPTRLYHQKRSAENVASTGGPEEPQPARAAQYRQLRREGLMTKVKPEKKTVKSEKNNTTSCSPTAHSCEQWNLHKQKNKCNAQHTKTNSPRKMERLQTDSELSNSAVGNTKKPLTSAENIQKTKKGIFTIDEKEINYAGAKFSDPPSPSVLPKPPSHWMDMTVQHSDQCKELMTYHLKALLKAQL